MDDSSEGTLHSRFNLGGSRTLNRLDEVGADVQLRARFTDLADEDMYATKGDPVPILDSAGFGAPSCIVDVELAAMTLGHPAHSVALESFEVALQELETIVRYPHG